MQLRAQQLQDAKPEELDFSNRLQSKEALNWSAGSSPAWEKTQSVNPTFMMTTARKMLESYSPFTSWLAAARLSRPPHEQPPTASPRPHLAVPSPIRSTYPGFRLCGPERISAGWWSESKVTRDYYIARFANGSIGWIFRNSSGEWYLHGWFG